MGRSSHRQRCASPLLAALVGLAVSSLGPVSSASGETELAASARAVAHDLGTVPARALVVASPLTCDVPAPRGEALSAKLASLVAAAAGGDAKAEPRPELLPAARARASVTRASVLIYLDVHVEAGELRVTADVYPVVANGWDRLRASVPPPSAHAYVHAPAAAEVRSYLPPRLLEQATLTKFPQPLGHVLAAACGDVEGDGGQGLVLVTSREVAWGHLGPSGFIPVARAPATSLGRRLPVPLREPLATAVVTRDGVYVGWGDRAGAVVGPDLAPKHPLFGLPVAYGSAVACVAPDPLHGGFAEARLDCAAGKALGPSAPLVADAWSSLDLGAVAPLVALRDPSGALHLRAPGVDEAVVNAVGAAVSLVDLDQDGTPDLATTSVAGDLLALSTWHPGGKVVARRQWPAPRGVDALATCPAGKDDAPSLMAVVGDEVWLVH